jgi:type I restriction enzyme, S subunit
MTNQEVRLRDLVTPRPGTRNPASGGAQTFLYVDLDAVDRDTKAVSSPKATPSDAAPSRARKIIKANDVLVALVRPNLNAVAMVPAELDNEIASTGFCVLRPNDRVLPQYLYYSVRTQRFVDNLCGLVSGAMYPAVTERQVLDQSIPLPSISEQRRVVDLLSRAESIVRMRREAEQKTREIIPALFLDMFGDPATNPKGCETRAVGTVVKLINGRAFKESEWGEDGLPIIRIQNLKDPRASFNRYSGSYDTRHVTNVGALLVAWAGQLVSFGVHIWDGPEGLLNQHIFRVEQLVPADKLFLRYALSHVVEEAKHGFHGIEVKHITKQALDRAQILFPSIGSQERFAELCVPALRIEKLTTEAAISAEKAFQSLLAGAFGA